MSSLIPYDSRIIDEIAIYIWEQVPAFNVAGGNDKQTQSYKVPLQFPPKITKDDRSADIESKELYTGEPFIVYKKYGARKITMELSYIVEDYRNWSPSKIAGICKRLRGYFTGPSAKGGVNNLIVGIEKLWLFGNHDNDGNFAGKPQKFIFKSIGISHSDTLISDRTKGYLHTFPLKTDITIEMWPIVNFIAGGDQNQNGKAPAKKQESNKLTLEWY
jgi:hypothetical protein